MSEHTETPRSDHPIEAFLCSVLDDLKGLADVPAWSMDADTTTRVMALAARVAAGVAELEARTISQAEALDLPAAAGCRSTGRWVQRTTGVTHRTARDKARLAGDLRRREHTRTALARGELHAEQATAIAGQVAKLDAERVGEGDQARAETYLLDQTDEHDADDLARMGHAIWELLDPEGAEAREARALEDEERRAAAATRLSMTDGGDGLTTGRFAVPTWVAVIFRKHLHALAAPKHVRAEQGAGSYDRQTPTAERLGRAFVDWITGYPGDALPQVGGLSATVMVVGDLDVLQGKLKAAMLETGHKISPSLLIAMACAHGITPAWMNAAGEVLALGRRHRFHTPQQRQAKLVETRHCEHASGCTVPAYLCHLHHRTPWASGGRTDLRDAQLLCPFHHHRVHATGQRHPQRE